MSPKLKKAILPLAVLVVGAALAILLATAREAPARKPQRAAAPLVETLTVQPETLQVEVVGQGTVQPKSRVQLVPQVAGKVVSIHPSLAAGGSFRRGELLVGIEPADYRLRVQRAEADVARARVNLQTQQAEATVARAEWENLHPDEEPNPLVVRQPQLDQARAELQAARAALAEAELALDRTRLTAPFTGRVESESVDVGQFVTSGQQVATIYATDVFEVPVPLDDDELEWFDSGRGAGDGSPATVRATTAGARTSWEGRLVRVAGVDPQTRMVTVVVEVRPTRGEEPGLEPGLFVDVVIHGRTLDGVITVPRWALHDGDRVWQVTDGTLRVLPVDVLRTGRERALLAGGLPAGAQVVVTNLDAVTDGMSVRVAGGPEAGDAAGAPGGAPAERGGDRPDAPPGEGAAP